MALLRWASGLYISTEFNMASISSVVRMFGNFRPIFGASSNLVGLFSNCPSNTKIYKMNEYWKYISLVYDW